MEDPMDVKREELIASLGGEAAVRRMDHEARADALEDFMSEKLDTAVAAKKNGKSYPTVAELESIVDQRGYRRGAGKLFIHERNNQNPYADDSGKKVPRLEPMPERPTLIDFFKLRFPPAAHLLQSARLAKRNGLSEEVILACLLHDAGQYLCRADHGYWGAQIVCGSAQTRRPPSHAAAAHSRRRKSSNRSPDIRSSPTDPDRSAAPGDT